MSDGYLSSIIAEIAEAASRDKTAGVTSNTPTNLLQSYGSPDTIEPVTSLARKLAASMRGAREPLSVQQALHPWTGDE